MRSTTVVEHLYLSMSVEQICQDLINKNNTEEALNELGTHLREEALRSSSSVRSTIPQVLLLVEDYPMEVLRVLINYTADNDENRFFLLSDDTAVSTFWALVLEMTLVSERISDLASRLTILISQFVRAGEESKSKFIQGIDEKGIIEWIWTFYATSVSKDIDSIEVPIEVLSDYASEFPQSISKQQIILVLQGLRNLLDLDYDEDLEDALYCHTTFLYNITKVEDTTLEIPTDEIIDCIPKIPSDYKNCINSKRNLFAACGGVFSFISYDNFNNIGSSVSTILKSTDGYAVAASAISLGNCVHDIDSKIRLIAEVDAVSSIETVATTLLHCNFGDVVQLQAFHFFNNCMTEQLAKSILIPDNEAVLFRNTKIIVDNYQYYKEVGAIYLKFLSKLVKNGMSNGVEIASFNSSWSYLNNLEEYCEVQMLILQSLCTSQVNNDEIRDTMRHSIKVLLDLKQTGVDANELLTKLKTIAILLENASTKLALLFPDSDYQTQFLDPITQFFTQVSRILLESASTSDPRAQLAQAAVANNSKFVAAMVLRKITSNQSPYRAEMETLHEVCRNVLSTPPHH